MADAPDAGNKDHGNGAQRREFLSVVSGTARQELGGKSEGLRSVIDQFLQARIGERGMARYRLGEAEARLVHLPDAIPGGADLVEESIDVHLIQITQFHSQRDFPGDDVVGAGLNLDPSDRAHLPSGDAGYDL